MNHMIDTLRSGQFWAGAVDGYLFGWAMLGWCWVLLWLYLAATASVWNTIPAAFSAAAWAIIVQRRFGRR